MLSTTLDSPGLKCQAFPVMFLSLADRWIMTMSHYRSLNKLPEAWVSSLVTKWPRIPCLFCARLFHQNPKSNLEIWLSHPRTTVCSIQEVQSPKPFPTHPPCSASAPTTSASVPKGPLILLNVLHYEDLFAARWRLLPPLNPCPLSPPPRHPSPLPMTKTVAHSDGCWRTQNPPSPSPPQSPSILWGNTWRPKAEGYPVFSLFLPHIQ